MSLSEQIGRVDGSQNDILKTILKAFGVTIGTEKIDAISDLANAASNLKDDGIFSTATKTALGLTSDASPDDALAILANAAILKDGNLQLPNGGSIPQIIEAGSYVGTGQYGAGKPNKIAISKTPNLVIVTGTWGAAGNNTQNFSAILNPAATGYGFPASSYTSSDVTGTISVTEDFFQWYSTVGAERQGNLSGITYNYIIFY